MLNFFDLVKSLEGREKTLFRDRIINACLIELQTWYTWNRRLKISRPNQKLIAIELDQPIETLFPETLTAL